LAGNPEGLFSDGLEGTDQVIIAGGHKLHCMRRKWGKAGERGRVSPQKGDAHRHHTLSTHWC
jgi:hypothetical protein